MIRSARRTIAAVPIHPNRYRAVDAGLDDPFGPSTVFGQTLRRLARCTRLDRIVLIRAASTPAPAIPDDPAVQRLITEHVTPGPIEDAMHAARTSARKWSPTAWRGGIGGATIYDEPLALGATTAAAQGCDADAVLIVGPDWPLIDPELCDALIERQRTNPEALRLVFTQAAPGLAGAIASTDLLGELAPKDASLGALLDYNPQVPQGDPIGKDPCVQVDPALRDAGVRFTYDALRWRRLLRAIEADAGAQVDTIDALSTAKLTAAHRASVHDPVPQQVRIEINTDRAATGPITPQHHTTVQRSPMQIDLARRIFDQLTIEPDVAVTIGGVGDPLLHPDFAGIVTAAHEAGIDGIHVESDLLVDRSAVESLTELPVDVVSVRLNADSPHTYRALMGTDGFEQVLGHIEWLLNNRRKEDGRGLPWIVPRLAKTMANVAELETFMDRWTHYCGHAVIESPTTACGTLPNLSVLDMAPPRRRPCRQLARRMTITADGRVPLCDQDLQVSTSIADLHHVAADDAWRALDAPRASHATGTLDELPCAGCTEWHRP